MGTQFSKLVNHIRAFNSGTPIDAEADLVRTTFDKFDQDKSGTIDAKELKRALSDLGMNASAKETIAVLNKSDCCDAPVQSHPAHLALFRPPHPVQPCPVSLLSIPDLGPTSPCPVPPHPTSSHPAAPNPTPPVQLRSI